MAKQDDYVRITIRIPQELHAKLAALPGDASLNAKIISSLQGFFDLQDVIPRIPGGERKYFIIENSETMKELVAQLKETLSEEKKLRPDIANLILEK